VVTFQGLDDTVLKIPATTDIQTISFNGENNRVFHIHDNQIMLDDQVITLIPASIIPTSIEKIHAGVWEELPNTNMSAVYYDWSPDAVYPGANSHKSVISTWNGAALDTKRNRMLFWGGGHSSYAGNEIYGFDFDTN
jgi:hypothetical protein